LSLLVLAALLGLRSFLQISRMVEVLPQKPLQELGCMKRRVYLPPRRLFHISIIKQQARKSHYIFLYPAVALAQPVCLAVAYGFRQMAGGDLFTAVKVGDSARHFQDTVIGAGA
jgi:hypothetical protein